MSNGVRDTLQLVMIFVILQFNIDNELRIGDTAVVFAQTATTVISDTMFAVADWSVQVKSEANASQTSIQATTGGNPGAFRSMQHILPRPASAAEAIIEVAHIFTGKTYNPGTQGAIEKLDYSEDIVLLSLPWPQPYVTSYLIVKQNDQIYRSTNFTFANGTSWDTGILTNLTAEDFMTLDGSGSKPDFSDSGSLIEFGYWRGSNRTNSSPLPEDGDIVLEHGIDNFHVTISHQKPANRPPVARDDVSTIGSSDEDQLLFLSVTLNDSDPDGDRLTISEVRGGGRVYQQTGISFTYPADADDRITLYYTVTDGEFFDEAEVTLIKDCSCFTSCFELGIGPLSTEVQEDSVDLDLLYRVRDELLQPTDDGARYVDIYYNTTPELLKVLLIDRPDLGARAVSMVEMLQPALRSMLQADGSTSITKAQMDTVAAVFADIGVAGSDSLQQVITDELDRLGQLDSYVGKPVAEVLGSVLGDSTLTSVGQYAETVPGDFALQQNFPNPFNPSTQILYHVSEATDVLLSIYNVRGQLIRTLVDEFQSVGGKIGGLGWIGRQGQ